jgi:DNA-binding NarL/FixJ family response regulator
MDSDAFLPLASEHEPPTQRMWAVPTAIPALEYDEPAAELWARICEGTLRIDEQRASEHHLLIALEQQTPAVSALEGRPLLVLEAVLQGHTANYVALDLGVAVSTASGDLKRALVALGLRPRLSAIPVYLAQISNAAERQETLRVCQGRFDARNARYVTLLLPKYENWLEESLSAVELQVCQMLLGGHTHDQIAAARGTAPRTIANQLGSVFSKLGASGRMEVVAKLARSVSAASDASRSPIV